MSNKFEYLISKDKLEIETKLKNNLGIYFSNYYLIGFGSFGVAFLDENRGFVGKFTTSETEFNAYVSILQFSALGISFQNLPKVYGIIPHITENFHFILKEYLYSTTNNFMEKRLVEMLSNEKDLTNLKIKAQLKLLGINNIDSNLNNYGHRGDGEFVLFDVDKGM